MNTNFLDVIIVGAGNAGLSASYYLQQYKLRHIVFERGKVGESWRSQRWDSFQVNTPNRFNTMPEGEIAGNEPDGFCTANEFVSSLEKYVARFKLPVVENTRVVSIEKNDTGLFTVSVTHNNSIHQYTSRQVIIASGIASEKKIPLPADKLPPNIAQLHSSEYCNPSQLPAGSVLVIGGAQSGIQIAEDLADAGRKVFLSTSMVARIPRYYRGKDCMDWLSLMKFFDVRPEDIPDPAMLNMKPPHLTGTGNGKRTISLQSLAKKGVILLGTMQDINERSILFQPNAAMHIKFADGFSAKVKSMINEFIEKNGLNAAVAETDMDDLPDTDAVCASTITILNPEENEIRSIIWATGFGGNFDYVRLPVFNKEGHPIHKEGISNADGLYFIGLPWLRNRKSTILFGIKEDARFIADKVFENIYDKTASPIPTG